MPSLCCACRTPLAAAVTRSEAGQQKRLLLLDRSQGWAVAEELPLDIGPRYFTAAAVVAPVAPTMMESPPACALAAADGAVGGVDAAASGVDAGLEAEGLLRGMAAEAAEGMEAADAADAPAFDLQLPEGLRHGDRLMLTLPTAAAKQHQKLLRKLEKQGARLPDCLVTCAHG